ncbi:hypothetical protein ACROYT_G002100 [Oculina patagonica]
MLHRLPLTKETPKTETQQQKADDSRLTDVLRNGSRCCTDVTCTSLVKTAKELLTRMEQIQTQLHNEVILWKLRFIRGICSTESRQNFYELLRKFNSFHEMLDAIIENEIKYLNAIDPEQEAGENADVEAAKALKKTPSEDKKALKRRAKFFTKVHERNVKLLFVVLNEVAECRSMVDSNSHECSDSLTLEMEETGRFLSVLKESNEELVEFTPSRRCSYKPE